ncbi:MAG: sensor histidine kinase N-terminal domain-containing protein [Burkholderiaceae bacterium]|nr:sensor histidine kinase N-terminal domain-containing protein [Burkholderiaceae bacterium]
MTGHAAAKEAHRGNSLRRTLLLGILLPICLFVAVDTFFLYRQALSAINTAYDRTLLASAKSIGELLKVQGKGEQARLSAAIPYSALEAFESDNRSRMVYRVSSPDGVLVDGFADLPMWQGKLPDQGPYAALVDFYDSAFRGDAIRMAVLLQPVSSETGLGMAVIQVGETLELRQTLARQILLDTLWRQALLISVLAGVVIWVVQRATRPVRRLSLELQARPTGDLTPITAQDAPRELQPLLVATNDVMSRLKSLLLHQKRFVRDTSHQLRTPLAVLKTQVQSALRGDVEPQTALTEIKHTVERATHLANQMLALSKVEQLRQQTDAIDLDWAKVLREVTLDISPLIAEKNLDFEIGTEPALLHAHDWMLRELSRNLLHNAIKYNPPHGALSVHLRVHELMAELRIGDSGPGISTELQQRLFQPFSAGDVRAGSGLGLAICAEVVQALGGSIRLDNRRENGVLVGLDTVVRLPLAAKAAAHTAPSLQT